MPRGRPRLLRRRRRNPLAQAARVGPMIQGAVPALDPLMVGAILTLCVLGIMNLVAVGDRSLAVHQSMTVVLGLGVLVWAWRTPSRWWNWLGRLAYAGSVVLLMGVAVHGVDAYGAKRWIDIGVLIQPSELAELGLILLLAEVMSHREWRERKRVGLTLILAVPPIALTLLEPDLSTSALLCLIVAVAMVLGRVRLKVLAGLLLAGLLFLPIGLHLLRPYQLARLHTYLSSGANGSSGGFTLLQSHIAIASGGLLGSGHSSIGQLLSSYLPARETDLAFASLVEQFGLITGGIAILAVLVLVWRLVSAATHSRTVQASLIAGVMAVLVGGEVVLSVGGNLGLLPLAGVPIPFLAYGGTVTIAHMAAFGFILAGRLDAERRPLWRIPLRLRSRPRLVRTLSGALALSLLMLGGYAYQLQVLKGGQLRQDALNEITRYIPLTPERGVIEDRQGQVLAAGPAADQVVAIPQLVPSHDLGGLAQLLDQTRARLSKEMSQPTDGGWTVTLAAQLAMVKATMLQAAGIPGVLVEPALGRSYPYGSLLGPIIGYTGVETPQQVKQFGPLPSGATLGQAGLEEQYNTLLSGRYGYQEILVNSQNVPVALGKTIPAVNGGTLVTGVDLGLQQLSTQLLQKAISGAYPGSQKGDQGAVVVMDPQNGQVLAMASWPAYNDNIFAAPRNSAAIEALLTQPGSPLLEHATQTAMPPGSNFKLVVSSADVYHHGIPTSQIIPTGYTFTYDGHTYHNWMTLPPQNLPEAIAWSNDVYFYKLAVALGAQNIISTGQAMGVGEPTGIDLPGEDPGYLGTPSSVAKLGETWYPGSTVILGIGQGYVTATPIQDAVWTSEVGTGTRVVPHLGLSESNGATSALKPISEPAPKPLPWASELGPVRAGLRLAVTGGTASMLSGLHVDAGGKTGTAQDPSAPNGGPDAWFTAMAPMSDPQVVVSMLVRGGGEGYYTDQPAVEQILKYFFANKSQIMSTISTASGVPVAPASPTPAAVAVPAAHRAAAASQRGSTSPGQLEVAIERAGLRFLPADGPADVVARLSSLPRSG
ncbi:MAG: FtsW/RodA/SpoVE family cell cycle protein [Candidatus Dormibacteria bacterium]